MAGYHLNDDESTVGACVGTGAHSSAAHMLTAKMETGELSPKDEAEQAGLESLHAEMEHGAIWDAATKDENTAEQQVLRITRTYRKHVAEIVKPIAVEKHLQAKHSSGLIISGHTDTIVTEPNLLRDLKTGVKSRWSAPQYGTYSRLLRANKIPITGIVEDYTKRVAITKNQPAPVEISYDVAQCEKIAETIIARIATDIEEWRESGEPTTFLANPSSMLCNKKYCRAWGTKFCTEHLGED